ncbi:MAG: NYN domain-containing protein, partial [Patescibacteria group bacterium]
MILKEKNYAFIDIQNLYLGVLSLGWKLDYKRFRVHLKEKYQVTKAYIFIGYVSTNQKLYDFLSKNDYRLIFKPTLSDKKNKVKGNIDADLVLR